MVKQLDRGVTVQEDTKSKGKEEKIFSFVFGGWLKTVVLIGKSTFTIQKFRCSGWMEVTDVQFFCYRKYIS